MEDGKPVFLTEPAEGCQTKEASICYYSTSYGVTEDATTTRTTATSVAPPECQTIYGCEVKDWETTATETSTEQCQRPTVAARVPRRGLATGVEARATGAPKARSAAVLGKRAYSEADMDRFYACETAGVNYIIYPAEFSGLSVVRIRQELMRRQEINGIRFLEVGSGLSLDPRRSSLTLFFHVDSVGVSVRHALEEFLGADLGYMYSYEVDASAPNNGPAVGRRGALLKEPGGVEHKNVTLPRRSRLSKRIVRSIEDDTPDRALVSLPEGENWKDETDKYTLVDETDKYTLVDETDKYTLVDENDDVYRYWSDHEGSAINGFNEQFIYIMESSEPSAMQLNHVEFGLQIPDMEGKQRPRTDVLNIPQTWGPAYQSTVDSRLHTDRVISKATGTRLGLVPQVHTIVVPFHGIPEPGQPIQPFERILEGLLRIAETVETYGHHRRAVVNMSWVARASTLSHFQIKAMNYLLNILNSQHVVLVAAAGNEAEEPGREQIDSYPALFGDDQNPNGGYIPNLIVVGATNEIGDKADFSQDAPWVTAYAYAEDAMVFDYDEPGNYATHPGAISFAAPIVSGLVSYLRAIDHHWQRGLEQPVNVKRLIGELAHIKRPLPRDVAVDPRKLIWNGEYAYIPASPGGPSKNKRQQSRDIRVISCLRDYDKWPSDAPPRNSICPELPDDLSKLLPKSPIPDNIIPVPKPVRFTTVEPGVPAGPTCTRDCEQGHTCSGYYCNPHPNPTDSPPDFSDPPFQPTKVTFTNLPTLSTTKPTPNRPPKPPPKEEVISIMRENTVDGVGSQFAIFAVLGGLDPCHHDPVSEQGFNSWTAMEPPNLNEKFKAYGYKGIWYERGADANGGLGVLHVPGRWGEKDGPVKCEWDGERGKRHKCPLSVVYWRQIRCVWDD